MCSGFSTLRMIYLINEDITCAKTFYLVYLSFLLSSCSLCLFLSWDYRGKSHRPLAVLVPFSFPSVTMLAAHAVETASQCLPKLRTCQPMIVEPCTSQTMPAKSQDAVSFCSTENWWISESFGWMENSQLNFREKKKSPSCCPTFSFQRLVPSFSFQNIFSIRFWQKMKNVFCIRRIVQLEIPPHKWYMII